MNLDDEIEDRILAVYAMLRKAEPCEWSEPGVADRKTELEQAAARATAY